MAQPPQVVPDPNMMIQMSMIAEEPEPQEPKQQKKRKTAKGTVPSRSFAQAFTLAGIRSALHTDEGVNQLVQTLKDNGCTVQDNKMGDMLHFIMENVDIVTRGPIIPFIPKREVTQVLESVYPNPGDKAVYRPGKSFTAVMKSLMRTIGVPDNIINGFAGSKRNYKFITWTNEGQQKAAIALQMTPEQLSAIKAAQAIEDDDEIEEEEPSEAGGAAPNTLRGAPGGMVAAFRLAQKRERASLRKGFTPKYDVLFSRTTWTYYIRVFMPMCDPSLLQQGITLDMYKGHLSLKGRYSVTPTLPPWTTQNEPIGDLEVIQPLPPNACGDFALQIPLPFDVDRAARKEVHVTDIGLIVSLKRLKEEIPQMEFKVHSFANAAPNAPNGGK